METGTDDWETAAARAKAMVESMMLTVSTEGTPNETQSAGSPVNAARSPSLLTAKRTKNKMSRTVLTKGMTRTDSGPASCSLPNSFLKLQINAKRSELSI